MIREGHIVAIEDMKQLVSKKKKRYCITLESVEEAERLLKSHKFDIYSCEKNKVIILANSSVAPLLKELSNYAITDMDIKGQTLEELFLYYYSKGENECQLPC